MNKKEDIRNHIEAIQNIVGNLYVRFIIDDRTYDALNENIQALYNALYNGVRNDTER